LPETHTHNTHNTHNMCTHAHTHTHTHTHLQPWPLVCVYWWALPPPWTPLSTSWMQPPLACWHMHSRDGSWVACTLEPISARALRMRFRARLWVGCTLRSPRVAGDDDDVPDVRAYVPGCGSAVHLGHPGLLVMMMCLQHPLLFVAGVGLMSRVLGHWVMLPAVSQR